MVTNPAQRYGSEIPKCKNHPEIPAQIKTNGISRGRCPECLRAHMLKAQAGRKKTRERDPKRTSGDTRPGRPSNNGNVIHLDFSGYPEILTKLREKSLDQMRTVEAQIVFMLRTL